MTRYIDVEALKNDGHPCWHDGEGNIYYEVDHAPTADVAEVKHGEWIPAKEKGIFGKEYYFCSHCKSRNGFAIKFNYCFNCGTIMKRG